MSQNHWSFGLSRSSNLTSPITNNPKSSRKTKRISLTGLPTKNDQPGIRNLSVFMPPAGGKVDGSLHRSFRQWSPCDACPLSSLHYLLANEDYYHNKTLSNLLLQKPKFFHIKWWHRRWRLSWCRYKYIHVEHPCFSCEPRQYIKRCRWVTPPKPYQLRNKPEKESWSVGRLEWHHQNDFFCCWWIRSSAWDTIPCLTAAAACELWRRKKKEKGSANLLFFFRLEVHMLLLYRSTSPSLRSGKCAYVTAWSYQLLFWWESNPKTQIQ